MAISYASNRMLPARADRQQKASGARDAPLLREAPVVLGRRAYHEEHNHVDHGDY